MDVNAALPYPAPTRQVAGEVNGVKTDVTSMSFADKIMITITQHGRLAQWVRIPAVNYSTQINTFLRKRE
jgi:proteasome assembly chaperone 3